MTLAIRCGPQTRDDWIICLIPDLNGIEFELSNYRSRSGALSLDQVNKWYLRGIGVVWAIQCQPQTRDDWIMCLIPDWNGIEFEISNYCWRSEAVSLERVSG